MAARGRPASAISTCQSSKELQAVIASTQSSNWQSMPAINTRRRSRTGSSDQSFIPVSPGGAVLAPR